MSNVKTKVLVCIPTFKRPPMLQILLASLGRQTVLEDPSVELSVAVFDNDPEQSAREVVEQFKELPVHYLPVPEPGLAAVRNEALRTARASSDFMVFIDDDEEACEDWIRSFFDAYRKTSCNILCGMRTPKFESGSKSWLIDDGFFEEPPKQDLSELKHGHTANTFLRCDLLRQHPVKFDPALSFTGGEDLLFFAQLQALGERMLYVRSAVVKDCIPHQRMKPSFLLTRAFRAGGTLLIVDLAIMGWPRTLPLRLARVLVWVTQALFIVLRSPARKASWLRSGLKVYMAAGTVAAIFGFQVQPYVYGRNKHAQSNLRKMQV